MDPKQLREIVGRATPGPWNSVDIGDYYGMNDEDAAVIGALRNHAEALLDVVEAAVVGSGCVFTPILGIAAPPCRQCSGCFIDAALARLREIP